MKTSPALLLVLPLALLVGLGAALACDKTDGTSAEDTASSEAPVAAQMVTLRVEEATCGGCVVPIRKELTLLTGVVKVEGDKDDYKDVLVTIVPGKVSNDQLIAAVKKAGYTATIKSAEGKRS